MRVLELSLRNYRVFEELDLELPARVIGIFGPNGAGKSTLVESVQYALYGKSRTAKDQIRTDGVLTDCVVRLVFEHGGQQYEIRRTIKGKNHQTEAELFVGDAQLAAGVTEVDEEIQKMLHMDPQVFRASVFAEQKQLDAFSEVTKGKRKEMVLRLLGIRPVDDARAAARKEARDTKAGADRLSGSLPDVTQQEKELEGARTAAEEAAARAKQAGEALREAERRADVAAKAFAESEKIRERVEQMTIERAAAERRIAELESHAATLTDRIQAIRKELEEEPGLVKERDALVGVADRLTAGRKLAEVAEEGRQLEAELAGLPEVDAAAALAELEAAEAELRAVEKAATKAESALERAKEDVATAEETLARAGKLDPSAPCPTCGQELGAGFESYVAHCRKDVARLKKVATTVAGDVREATAARKAATARLSKAKTVGESARKATDRRGALSERLTKLRERFADLTAPFDGKPPDLARLEADAARAGEVGTRLAELKSERKHLAAAEADMKKTAAGLVDSRKRIQELDREAATLAFDAEEHERRRKERDESQHLVGLARSSEREASDRDKAARARVGELQAELRKVKEIAARASELRADARLLDRVSGLLEGFRTFLYGRIMPQISQDAEALFRELTNHEYEDLMIDEETLAIRIADGARYFPVERFSGSEADLANLALRVAISMHLSRMSGADVGMMVLDEVLAALDAERKDLFVQTIGRLAGRFHQLFVITHAEQVKDQFGASIQVRKTGRRRSTAELV
jgi:exonuclease SbcC